MRLFLCTVSFAMALALQAQDTGITVAPLPSGPVIKAEKRLVLVDAIVADKHGNYIRDLTAKDFRVWEDKKEQSIESFSFEAGTNSPNAQKRYLVLFFDNSTMAFSEQVQARKAAQQFVDTNAGPDKEVAVVNFGGSLQIAQNFTEDTDRLKQAISGVKFSFVSPNGDVGGAALSSAAAQFGARDALLAIRSLAKGLASVPGRKTLVFLSSGFPLDSELRSELTAVINVCNKNNVAIYPIDVRGLVALAPDGHSQLFNSYAGVHLVTASYVQQRGGTPAGGTGAGAGRGGTTGGTGAGRGGTTASSPSRGTTAPVNNNINRNPLNSPLNPNNPFNQARSLIPQIPNVSRNQEVLYDLANGTGGFVIVNTNDLLAGLQKIGHEQDAYYVLGYTPEPSKEGACHDLKVKVDRGGVEVRARTGYCSTKPLDVLAGSPVEHDLETRAAAAAPGNVQASMALPFFYTSSNTARVNVAIEIPSETLQFQKEKGKQHSEVNVLGIVTDEQGSVAARFSDNVKVDFENKKQVEQFQEKSMHYQTQFDIGAGKYNVKVVFSSGGQSFGKLEIPINIDRYDNSKFGISSVALSHEVHKMSDLDVALDATLLQDHTPLVSEGMEIVPTGSNTFSKSGLAVAYLEVYEPVLQQTPQPAANFKVGVDLKLVDKKTGQQKIDTGYITLAPYIKTGNPMIPVGMRIPIEKLDPGTYIAQFQAVDTTGNTSVLRSTEFVIR
ncbi:MAG TPA: VWA domain-containing protein [Bryobacteraceae bacterium]|nr:VWA domain-containing protein [Bryobacteraceae bacterium]